MTWISADFSHAMLGNSTPSWDDVSSATHASDLVINSLKPFLFFGVRSAQNDGNLSKCHPLGRQESDSTLFGVQ